MLVFPSCKINLGLQVTEKRPDGFHNLETIFYPVPIFDALESIIGSADENPSIKISGLEVPGRADENLILKAYHLLKTDFPELPAVSLFLHKMIPMGAGLGGGSADAAFALQLFNQQFSLELQQDELIAYALQLGSDCPFFMLNTPCFASGRGEQLEPVALSLKGYQLYIVNPAIHVATRWAFAQLIPGRQKADIRAVLTTVPENWKQLLVNDFQESVCSAYPELKAIPDRMYEAGAIYAAMSGSGSSFFGIFPGNVTIDLAWPAHYFSRLLVCEH